MSREYKDDDGRVIADMSFLENDHPRFGKPRRDLRQPEEPQEDSSRPWEQSSFKPTAKEQLLVILGAMKATMLIALAYIVGIGGIVALMLWFWT